MGSLRRLLAPSFSDFLFISLIAWLFMSSPDGWSRLLLDGDTGWHIRTGEFILSNGYVPKVDPFSFSKHGQPWFAWEWLADVVYAWLHTHWGLKGLVLFSGVQISLFSVILFRMMLWKGANPLVALPVSLLAVGAATVHYLARPHLFTLLFLPVCLWLVEDDRRSPRRAVWLTVPITLFWTNLHGGFLAWIACLGLLVAGEAVEQFWGARDWARVKRYGLLLAASAAVTVVNPYGIRLHQHIAGYLTSDWIRDMVQEFQSPSFRTENMIQFEMLLFAGMLAAGSVLYRRGVVEPLWILFWAHQGLGSVRHVTVFVTVAAPTIAAEASYWWTRWVEPASRKSIRRILDSLGTDIRGNFGWTSLWPVIGLCTIMVASPFPWPQDFPIERFPTGLVSKHADLLSRSRVLTLDQWADYLIYRFYPNQRVFFDGRSDFYGPDLGGQYVRLSGGRQDWRQIVDRHKFEVALIPAEWAMASLLKQQSDWKLIEDNGKALLFQRIETRQAQPQPMPGKFPGTNLMN